MNETAEMAAIEAGVRDLTLAVIPFALVVVGVVLGFVMRRKAKAEKFRLLPFVICNTIALLGGYGLYASMRASPQKSQQASGVVPNPSAATITENANDVPVGWRILVWSPSEVAEAEKQAAVRVAGLLEKSGVPDAKVQVRLANMRSGDKILGRYTASTQDGIVLEHIEGVVAQKRVVLVCAPQNPGTFVFSGSECETRMRRTFGDFVPLSAQSSGAK